VSRSGRVRSLRIGNGGTKLYPLGLNGDGSEYRPGIEPVTVDIYKVVRDPDGVKPCSFGRECIFDRL
jgi:hypothetical protein